MEHFLDGTTPGSCLFLHAGLSHQSDSSVTAVLLTSFQNGCQADKKGSMYATACDSKRVSVNEPLGDHSSSPLQPYRRMQMNNPRFSPPEHSWPAEHLDKLSLWLLSSRHLLELLIHQPVPYSKDSGSKRRPSHISIGQRLASVARLG